MDYNEPNFTNLLSQQIQAFWTLLQIKLYQDFINFWYIDCWGLFSNYVLFLPIDILKNVFLHLENMDNPLI